MKNEQNVIYRKDYKKPNFLISNIELTFDIFTDYTIVKSLMKVKRNCEVRNPLILNGENLELETVLLDNKTLTKKNFSVDDEFLTIENVPNDFELEIITKIKPHKNTSLDGLYVSGNILCTQNEPEGFRHITYFLDRPDVMAKYKTKIIAALAKYPILLSNGNKISSGNCKEGRHYVEWEDPFPKPSYLFALVAGDLGVIEDSFKTMTGREIALSIFVDKGEELKAQYAMTSLKKAMKWDEKEFGLECDLDNYMIVAVESFNFGAMENKGLNIFNSKYVLADTETATDNDFQQIEGVIGHEYFHNWTGNRITCRDWFQLTLKEGLTVFRDQEFSSDINSRAVQRIADVQVLRNSQFAEDAGPISHPIRPESYIEINNFYTSTIYNKGAEVIRMIHTLIGEKSFRKGIDKYFKLYDGQAVTTDDFINAMELASNYDLTQFKNWYSQNGTPACKVSEKFNEKKKEYSLTIEQEYQKQQKPFLYPLKLSLLNSSDGKDILSKILTISKNKESFTFTNIPEKPIPSLLQDFSAPIKLKFDYSDNDLLFLLKNDKNDFNRFETGQIIVKSAINNLLNSLKNNQMLLVDDNILNAYGSLINDKKTDYALRAKTLTLPSLSTIMNDNNFCDLDKISDLKDFLITAIALKNENLLIETYLFLIDNIKTHNDNEKGKRSLKNIILKYLASLGTYTNLVYEQFQKSDNMTDSIASLAILCDSNSEERDLALEQFYEKWSNNSLVMCKWFSVQAMSKTTSDVSNIIKLSNNSAFDIKNPNKIRALFDSFTANMTEFHNKNGLGYKMIAEKILEYDTFNPNLSAILAKRFEKYPKLDTKRQSLAKKELNTILNTKNISKDLSEIVNKILF